jgi:uncharacterized membrane protein
MSEPQMPPPPPFGAPAAPPPPPGSPGSGVSENRTLWIVLSYFGILALIPLLVEKNDSEVQWHAKHGLVLTICWVVLSVGLWVVGFAAAAAFAPLGCVVSLVNLALVVGILIIHVTCIIKGLNGERFKVPVLSDFAEKL